MIRKGIYSVEQYAGRAVRAAFRIWAMHKAGILGSMAINMALAIVLLMFGMHSQSHLYQSIIHLDFESEHQIIPPAAKEPTELPVDNALINPEPGYESVRNIAVDATKKELNPGLTDEKKTDAEELYHDAARARQQMQSNQQQWDDAQSNEEANVPNVEEKNTAPTETGQFKGPAVISYYLLGRQALWLPVPAYQCEQGGQVVVDLEVNPNGTVAHASVDQTRSMSNSCVSAAALKAAYRSRFSVSLHATPNQKGSITYLFVPQ